MKKNLVAVTLAALTLPGIPSVVVAVPAPLTWTDGAGNFLWDSTSTNWTAGSGNIAWTSPNAALLGATGIGAITVSGGPTVSSLTVSAAGYSLAGGQINLGSPSTAFEISNNIIIGSVIGGANALVKSGPGSLTFTGANTYTGGTTLNGGTLVLNAGAFANGVLHGAATVNSGATLSLQGNYSFIFPTYFGDTINVNDGGTLSVSGGNTQESASYISAVNLASSALGGSVTTPDNSSLRLQGGLLTSTGAVVNTFAANIVLVNPGSVTTTLTAGAGNTLNLSGVIKDYFAYPNTGLLFNGAGKLVLSGANTYGGTTTVSNVTLLVNGDLGATAVSVRSGAAVGGIGKLGGSLTLVSGAILDLAVTSGATNGVTVAGTSTLNGTITVSPVRLGGATLLPGLYTVFTASGGRSGAHSFSWSDPVGQFATATFAINGTAISVSLAAAAPTVTTLAATNITATSATLNGTVNPNGAVLSTNYFQYGLTTNYGSFSATNTLTAAYGVSAVTNQLTNLAPGTVYHYRLVAANSVGTTLGSDLTFFSLLLPAAVVTLNGPATVTNECHSPYPTRARSPGQVPLPGAIVTVWRCGATGRSPRGDTIPRPNGHPRGRHLSLAGRGCERRRHHLLAGSDVQSLWHAGRWRHPWRPERRRRGEPVGVGRGVCQLRDQQCASLHGQRGGTGRHERDLRTLQLRLRRLQCAILHQPRGLDPARPGPATLPFHRHQRAVTAAAVLSLELSVRSGTNNPTRFYRVRSP